MTFVFFAVPISSMTSFIISRFLTATQWIYLVGFATFYLVIALFLVITFDDTEMLVYDLRTNDGSRIASKKSKAASD